MNGFMKRKWVRLTTIAIIFAFMISVANPVFAHPGRTDSSGCHTCRTNCPKWGLSYGEYHCHRAKALPQPIEPIKSHKVEGGTGYTTPAPEYKIPKVETKKVENNKPVNKVETKSSANNAKLSFWGRVWSFLRIK
jgi:hypothetical protein